MVDHGRRTGFHDRKGCIMTTVEDAVAEATGPGLDEEKLEAFAERMLQIVNLGMTANMMSIGHQVGLFDAMAALPTHATSEEIAASAELDERYVREWLGAMTTAGIVEYDGGKGGYLLPPEHAALTTRAAGPNNFAAYTQFIPMCGSIEPELLNSFRDGGGVPYSSYPRFHSAMRELSAAVFDATLVDVTLPLVPGLGERLRSGISVADVGTGSGHAVNVMAKAFPNSTFTGFDIAEEALAVGRAEAEEWGLTNASFVVRDAAHLDDVGTFDFITTFDAVHDQVDPHAMVQGIFDMLEPGGHWLCVDIQASSHVGENISHPMAPFLYSVSCSHCMTVSLAHDGAGLGAVWGVQTARSMFTEAGFVDIEIHHVEGDVTNNYYVCRKP
jgi:2-polyprenyl-3-methyl-5-hydroxy-6-metoxy-1,4-benzoquinol methylase